MSCVVLFIQVGIQWQNPGIGLPILGDSCFVPGNSPRPDPIQDLTNTTEVFYYERLEPRTHRPRREITVVFNFTWTAPHVPYGKLLRYNIWLGPEILNDPNDDREFYRLEVGV